MEDNHENNRQIIQFAKHTTPLPIEVKQNQGSDRVMWYGLDNLYPNFLLKLYNNSPLHKGIINSKADYIIGDGVVNRESSEKFNPNVNSIDNLEELVQKIVIDYIIFGYFGIEVIYNLLGEAIEFVHIPAHHIRANRSLTLFNVCDDWFSNSRNLLSYNRWTRANNSDGKSKLFFYKNYTPDTNIVYPTPEYSGAIKSLETDLAIRDFHLNNITNGFSVSSLITFYGASLPPEQKRDFEKKISNAYTGTNGAKFIIDFQNIGGQKADVQNISSNDWDKAYSLVKASVEQDILVAHSATSPMLFGLQQEGKLGGANELEVGYEIFKNLYVKNKRNEIEAGLNKVFASAGYPVIEFKDKGALFGNRVSDLTKEKVYTVNEIRKIEGLPALPDGDKILNDMVKPEPTKFSNHHQCFNDHKDEGEYRLLSTEDFEKVKHLGSTKDLFELIDKSDAIESFSHLNQIINRFDDDDSINNYLLKADLNGKSVSDIRTNIKKDLAISISVSDLKDKLSKMNQSGVLNIKVTGDSIEASKPKSQNVQPVKPSDAKNAVEVVYSYEGPKDDRNRAFCAKILETDRFYTREDIQSMSSIFGYDIFKYRGGWYHNPKTNEDTPWCRHQWFANRVIRK